jgi:hypothetical protein
VHISVGSAFAFEPADGLSGAWKPKVEVEGKGMDDLDLDLDLDLVGNHSCRLEDMLVVGLERNRDHDIPEPVAVLENEEVK